MSWHYQVMRHKGPDNGDYFYVHEYYNMEEGNCWTEEGVKVGGESLEDIKWQLKTILNDLEKYPVMDYGED